MKPCPECRRDHHDERLLYCLEDSSALIQGSVPVTDLMRAAILPDASEARTGPFEPPAVTTAAD